MESLPKDILVHELAPRLNLFSMVAYSRVSKSIYARTTRFNLIDPCVGAITSTHYDYETLQRLTINISKNRRYRGRLIEILPSIVGKLDLRTLQRIYYAYLEDAEIDYTIVIRQIVSTYPLHGKLIKQTKGWFDQTTDCYRGFVKLWSRITNRQTNPTDSTNPRLADLLTAALRDLKCQFSDVHWIENLASRYLAELLIAKLNNDDIAYLCREMRGQTIAVSNRNHYNNRSYELFVWLYYLLYRAGRLTLELVNASPFDSCGPILAILPGDSDLAHKIVMTTTSTKRTADDLILDPEQARNNLSTDLTPHVVLSPQDYVEALFSIPRAITKRLERIASVVKTNAYRDGYNVWYEMVESLLRERGCKYSVTWGWYCV